SGAAPRRDGSTRKPERAAGASPVPAPNSAWLRRPAPRGLAGPPGADRGRRRRVEPSPRAPRETACRRTRCRASKLHRVRRDGSVGALDDAADPPLRVREKPLAAALQLRATLVGKDRLVELRLAPFEALHDLLE